MLKNKNVKCLLPRFNLLNINEKQHTAHKDYYKTRGAFRESNTQPNPQRPSALYAPRRYVAWLAFAYAEATMGLAINI